ncbi:MAG: Sec-independent protein translocase protein TatB [Methylotenera sp.]|nr:Sec-independent protein translocase protein TatB [Methylotenera sp.]
MFDIAFSELVIVAIVALIVIGPEKLPKVARTLGTLIGRMQRYMTQIKDEVNRESRFAELQQLQQEVQEAVSGAQANLESQVSNLTHNIADVSRETDSQVQEAIVSDVESLPDQNQSKQKS